MQRRAAPRSYRTHGAAQPGAGHGPFAADGCRRDLQRLGGFVERQTSVETELHDARLLRKDVRKTIEGEIESDDVEVLLFADVDGEFDGHRSRAAAALVAPFAPRVIDKDAAHDRRRDGEKVDAVAEGDMALVSKSNVQLVHECGRLQRVPFALASEMPLGD